MSRDKILQKEYNAAYYENRKLKRKSQIQERQRQIRDAVQEYKLNSGCVGCGYNKSARALHFHHSGDEQKEHTIARMTGQGRALEAIIEEARKCVVLCANCHAEAHEFGGIR